MLGACKSLGFELSHVDCRSIDVEAGGRRETLADLLRAELRSGATDARVALQAGNRWRQDYEPVRLEGNGAEETPHLRPGGTYLVTGGLGGIGLVLAGVVAESAPGAKLVLIGRSPLPDPDGVRLARKAKVADGNVAVAGS